MGKKTESDLKKSARDSFSTIGKVSEKTGVKPYILRYWEREFPFLQPIKNRAGHRLYSDRDIYIVKNIKELVHGKGYSIQGAKKVLLDMLLGRKQDPKGKYIDEIRADLLEMLETINRNLNS
jgi:DNA-binding transcriptional MerR regulator